MKTTDCLALPYPECAPPLVKDASDIEQFRDLALATDAAVQALADSVSENLRNPDSASMFGTRASTGQDVTHFYPTVDFDNANMGDTNADLIRIQEDGWYMCGGWVQANSTSLPNSIGLRVEPIVNGDPITSRQGPGQPAVGDEFVSWVDMLFLRAGDALQAMSHHTASSALNVTYISRIWAHLVIANV